MQIMSGNQASLPTGLYEKVARYRCQVFVEHLGWNLKTREGNEYDQFDRPDTVYVVAKDDYGRVLGCARLLPTIRPYLLSEVFPKLLGGEVLPCTSEVWELSRFAAFDHDHVTPGSIKQFSSPVAISVLREAIAHAVAHGVKRLITVSPLGVERLLRRAGFKASRGGPPMNVDGHQIFACWIDAVEDESLLSRTRTLRLNADDTKCRC